MAANRKNKLSTKRKRGANSPSLGSLAGGIRQGKAEGSPEGHAARIPAQTAEKTQQVVERQKPGGQQNQTPVYDGVTAELVRLRQSLAQHWPVYNNWTNLSDLPMVSIRTAVNKSQTTPAGYTKRKTSLQENEMKATPKGTHGQKVSSATELDSLKSQRAIKMDGLKQSMNTEATRDQPKDQAIRVRCPEGGGKRLASQTGALKTFQPGEKPTGRITKGRPTRVAPLFKQPAASTLQRNVGTGPSTSKVQLKDGGGPEESKGGCGEAGSLRSCPMCQEEFPPGMSQLDMDGHIAACLSASSEDIMW
ncbi:ubiquitin-dependent protein binding [Branchiostoma belcheri]|nr:ubiquitin-dependent protein binding [Branchiostoma belcheri]